MLSVVIKSIKYKFIFKNIYLSLYIVIINTLIETTP
jgi:hypothetical protein